MAKNKQSVSTTRFQIPLLISGTIWLFAGFLLVLALVSYHNGDPGKNWLGLTGHLLSWCCVYLFGLSSFLLPVFLLGVGWRVVKNQKISRLPFKVFSFLAFLLVFSIFLAMVSEWSFTFSGLFERWICADYYPRSESYDPSKFRYYLGGVPMHHLYMDTAINFKRFLGEVGTFFTLIFLFFLFGSFSINSSFSKYFTMIKDLFLRLYRWIARKDLLFAHLGKRKSPPPVKQRHASTPSLVRDDPLKMVTRIKIPEAKIEKEPSFSPKQTKQDFSKGYVLPPPTLLTKVKPGDLSTLKNDLRRKAEILEETLLSFGLEAKVGDIHCGPTITSFEIHPAVGVKVQKIKALESDIALNMQAQSIRIIAPIPGKAAVGIEVPNPQPQEVGFRELLENYHQSGKKSSIPLLLGKMVNGEDVWADLTKMPHLIIAGATGSGKSVCINTIVMSIVMNAHPDEIKLVMVDPKKVELTAYTHLPHMLSPVITEPAGACAALGWLVKEMERRYEIFRQLGIRNIHSFNTRTINTALETSLDLEIPEKMPFIVVIIDELADLMMISASDIETPIARIAQMARAVGIHLILATQRPSREVITGLIKANFPCRIAFKVSSRINSQIIIDDNGADTLLGNGDMLFLPPGTSNLVRAQGAFIRDDDINKVISHICSQASTNYLIPSFDLFRGGIEDLNGELEGSSRDALYEEAMKLVLETGNASTTFLQRKLKIGYARAASLMDQLEERGVIGPSEGAKPRKIYRLQDKDEE